eukprot:CAMPEP_0169406410 /NCGR_PEP_ID=MMETSP1017-20121227/57505_1 /TAXON_ID=342587 /ORGANISM="Karlodinium micrum, Strain CCMP2283" /LENGTH=57 /DNA_ID=CAMNT_0009513151 /DNA_START=468 /DNA_END=641 /DNA_ORIENTATION=+
MITPIDHPLSPSGGVEDHVNGDVTISEIWVTESACVADRSTGHLLIWTSATRKTEDI